MPLDPQVQRILEQAQAAGVRAFHEMSVPEAREQMNSASVLLGTGPELAQVEDVSIPGPLGTIPARIYRPTDQTDVPGILYFHGGGWVVGSVQTHDAYCRGLAAASEMVVISVDYRLAPEHQYPAAAEDSYAATRWVAEQARELGIDSTRLAVAGDSAGGNLATVVCLMARDRGGPAIRYQVLIYPITDHSFNTMSYQQCAEGYHLTLGTMRWFWENYLSRPEDGDQAYASPLRAKNLAGLPPALVLTAEYDPLRDEGEAYATRLAEAGVPVQTIRYTGMIHGFVRRLQSLPAADRALEDVARALRSALLPGG